MIFIHNTYNRPKEVLKTINKEKQHFENAKFIVVYNSNIDTSELEENGVDCFYFGKNKGHKLGCANAVFSGLKYAYDKYGLGETILFSHDDIYLSNIEKFNTSIKLLDKNDFVSRRYTGTYSNDNTYIMMESFLIKSDIIPKFINGYNHNDISNLPKDNNKSECPEMYFGNKVQTLIEKKHLFEMPENSFGENIMGYFHIKNVRGQGDKNR